MNFSISFVFFGILALQVIEGSVESSGFSDAALHSYANELVNPFMKRTSELNQTIQNYWALYDKNMDSINSKFNHLKDLSPKDSETRNTCHELQDVMANAEDTVNNATVVLVEVLQKMALTINKPPSCLTINIFAATSCLAHKAQYVRNIYKDYKEQIVSNDLAAAEAIKEIVVEFIYCLKRLGN